jgi:lipocalin
LQSVDTRFFLFAKQFQGKWYNIERYGHPLAKKSNCSTVEYVSTQADGWYSLVTDGVNLDTGEKVETNFSAVLSDPNAEPLIGKFNISVFERKFTIVLRKYLSN